MSTRQLIPSKSAAVTFPSFPPVRSGLLQRKCACSGTPGLSSECEACRKKRLQRKIAQPSTLSHQHSEVPPIVHEVLRSPGEPLDAPTREFMESRFNHGFSRVRVHADERAAASARCINALAYTVGRDVVFDAGQFRPHNSAGKEMIAHELAHVVQQQFLLSASGRLQIQGGTSVAEREAEQASQVVGARGAAIRQPFTASLPQIARQPRPNPQTASPLATSSSPSPMTRAEFEVTVRQRFGVPTVRTGTLQEQEQKSTRRGAPIPPHINPATWHSWDPGSASEIYRWIISSLESVSANFGGIPNVQEIVFFEVEYDQDTTSGAVVARPEVGASYGAGVMTIFHSGISRWAAFPTERSSTQPPQNRPTAVVQTPGSSPGADLPLPTPEQSAERTMTHELGHGLAETALTPPASGGAALDASMMDDYKRAVGWIGPAGSERLFDIGAQAVQTAITNASPPPATFEITEAHWNDPRWVEQPMSGYMVRGGPSEDFSEAVSAYVHTPAALRARSPRRYAFLDSRKSRWQPGLRQVTAARTPSQQSGGNRPAPYEPRRDFNREILKSAEDL
jgi:Domain of unknown function (DUF4157)